MTGSDVIGQVIVYVLGTAGVGGLGYYAKNWKTIRTRIRERHQQQTDIYTWIVGRKPTELEPHPPPGIQKQVDDNTAATGENTNATYLMSQRMNQWNGKLSRIEEMVTAIAGVPTAVTLPEIVTAVAEHDQHAAAKQNQILDAINNPKET
jgi:hypothetical protein